MAEGPDKPKKKRSLFWRSVRFLFRAVLILLLLVVTAGFIIGYFYGEEVKGYLIGQINKQLNTTILVDSKDISFSVFQNFPNASVEFRNVKVLDAVFKARRDTLLRAGNISLRFSILDIFKKNYDIRKIELSDAKLKLKRYKDGTDNWHVLRESADTVQSNVSFRLQKIILDNVSVSYLDKKGRQDYALVFKDAELKGDFSGESYSLDASGNTFVDHFRSDSTDYLSRKDVNLVLGMDVQKDRYIIRKGTVKVAQLSLSVSGTYAALPGKGDMDLTFKGKEMDIQSFLSLLPEKLRDKISGYKSSGNMYFEALVKGESSEHASPGVRAKFGIDNGEISQRGSSISLKEVSLSGTYASGRTAEESVLDVRNFSCSIGDGTCSGHFQLTNLSSPTVKAAARGQMKLDDLQEFLKIDTIESMTGSLRINASFEGKVREAKKYAQELKHSTSSGELTLANANIKFRNNPREWTGIDANLLLDNNDIAINNLKGNIANSDIELTGFFRNILAYLFLDNESLTIEARLKSKNIDLNEILMNRQTTTKHDTVYRIDLSPKLNVSFTADIGHLVFRKFDAETVKGHFRLADQRLVADTVAFRSMNGTVFASGKVEEGDNGNVLLTCDASLRKIGIDKLFYAFENFGQDYLQDKNLKGSVTADVKFASVCKPDLTLIENKIYAHSNITIEKGELIGWEPLRQLSRFISLSELADVKFSTLTNEIEIKDRKIFIPVMEVNSSAMNVTCSGTHSFDNAIDYKFKILLSELLAKKARKAKKENDEFGVEEDDGLGRTSIYLSMTGTVDNPVIRYDKKEALAKFKKDLKTEKHTIKSILHDEFGWFKKDTTLVKDKKQQGKEEKFKIKWDEDEKSNDEDEPK